LVSMFLKKLIFLTSYWIQRELPLDVLVTLTMRKKKIIMIRVMVKDIFLHKYDWS
jgi:hypothetical protein